MSKYDNDSPFIGGKKQENHSPLVEKNSRGLFKRKLDEDGEINEGNVSYEISDNFENYAESNQKSEEFFTKMHLNSDDIERLKNDQVTEDEKQKILAKMFNLSEDASDNEKKEVIKKSWKRNV